jgi:phage terminase Nu1 subunit (DNA packaging protein)
MVNRQFYTVEELAEITGLSKRAVLKWTSASAPQVHLRSYKASGAKNNKVLVRMEDWDAYLSRHATQPDSG